MCTVQLTCERGQPLSATFNFNKMGSSLLSEPGTDDPLLLTRLESSLSEDNDDFVVAAKQKSYTQQYANIYFLRLSILKDIVLEQANSRWDGIQMLQQTAKLTDRVLDVRQGELTWIVGTIYMDMHLKPNILEDLSAEKLVTGAIPKSKWRDPRQDSIQLEDESGRLSLIGHKIAEETLCTGIVIAVLGSETQSGDFEVVDICHAEFPPQSAPPEMMETSQDKYVALISGLDISGEDFETLETHLLLQYLTGELLGPADQVTASQITQVIIAGNSIADTPIKEEDAMTRRTKKYGYDAASYNARPTLILDEFFASLLPSLPLIVMPGANDPTNVTLPQQPVHRIMFPKTLHYTAATFRSTTNPAWLEIDGVKMLGTSGQTIDDIYHYVDGEDRLDMMESTLRWRHCAPTAPDTLCKQDRHLLQDS